MWRSGGHAMNARNQSSRVRRVSRAGQGGATMIEVLVSVVIISVGLLGIAGLQLMAMRNSQGALQDSLATMYTYSILDSMRANVTAARDGDYNVNEMCDAPEPDGLVEADQAFWIDAVQEQLGPSACGTIECDDDDLCTVTIEWSDSGDRDGELPRSIETETQL